MIRYFLAPLIFFLYLIYHKANPEYIGPLVVGTALFISLALNTIFHLKILQLKHTKDIRFVNELSKKFQAINITVDVVLISILLPFGGGVLNPFSLILVLEIIVAAILYSSKASIAEVLMFIIIQGCFFLKPPANLDLNAQYFFSFVVYIFFLLVIALLLSILTMPLHITRSERTDLDMVTNNIDKLRRKKDQLEQLQKITSQIVYSAEIESILNSIVNGIKNVLNCGVVLLSLYDKKKMVYRRAAYSGLSIGEWEQLKSTVLSVKDFKKFLKDEFKIMGGYHIPGSYTENSNLNDYTLSVEEQNRSSGSGNWHSEDIMLFPILGKKQDIIGYFTIDRPHNNEIPEGEVLEELTIFINTAGFALQNLENFAELSGLNTKLRMVYEVNTIITRLSQEAGYLQKICQTIKNSLGYLNVAILLKEKKYLKIVASLGYEPNIVKHKKLRIGRDGITGWVAKTGIAQIINNVSKDSRYVQGVIKANSELAIPIKFGYDNILGVLDVESEKLNAFTHNDLELLNLIANQLGIALMNNQLFNQTVELSKIDEMTQLYNYRVFKETLDIEISRSSRYEHKFSLMMLDIDDFKKVNDTYGHQQGDLVLQELAKIMKEIVRDTDIVARYGGEEFMIVLPETGKKATLDSANRLLKEISEKEIPLINNESKSLHITVSIGIATFPKDGRNANDLIKKVDTALYQAKKNGKNRVEIAKK
jgi:diguanylate cyclase (GGDEF)-like protein